MARGFKRRGRGPSVRYAAVLDSFERDLLVDLLRRVADLLDPTGQFAAAAPAGSAPDPGGDAFDGIVAGLGELGRADLEASAGSAAGPQADPREPAYDVDDPALQRLLPAGNLADDEAAAEFRRLTETSLRERKVANLTTSAELLAQIDDGDSAVSLSPEQALAFLVALTDVRLVLASRLGLETDEDAEEVHRLAVGDDDDPRAQAAALYGFLSWLQETLAGCLRP